MLLLPKLLEGQSPKLRGLGGGLGSAVRVERRCMANFVGFKGTKKEMGKETLTWAVNQTRGCGLQGRRVSPAFRITGFETSGGFQCWDCLKWGEGRLCDRGTTGKTPSRPRLFGGMRCRSYRGRLKDLERLLRATPVIRYVQCFSTHLSPILRRFEHP